MTNHFYGLNPKEKFTPLDVREAVVWCFIKAHGKILEETCRDSSEIPPEELKKFKELNVRELVWQYFVEVGGDYNRPNKESLVKVCDKLKEFASHFRGQKIIAKNYEQMMKLINKLPE
jgi:hypothetical protein